jgi:cytochrome c-type biogenesis protein CcmH
VRRALLALALLLAALPAAAGAAAQPGWTIDGISQQLMCPICKERLDMSTSPAADQIRANLARWHRLGWSEARVERQLVDDYGEQVLAAPPKSGFGLAAWLVPGAVLLAGAGVAVWLAQRWASARSPAQAALASGPRGAERERLERRLDAELRDFDA